MEQSELIVCLYCWQTWKEFRLPWHSFVRVQFYFKYYLSINRKEIYYLFGNRPWRSGESTGLWNQGSWVRIPHYTFSFESNYLFFPCLTFLLFSISPEGKQCANIYWKYDNKEFAMEKRPSFFIFQNANTPAHKGTIKRIAWLHVSSFLFKIQ